MLRGLNEVLYIFPAVPSTRLALGSVKCLLAPCTVNCNNFVFKHKEISSDFPVLLKNLTWVEVRWRQLTGLYCVLTWFYGGKQTMRAL